MFLNHGWTLAKSFWEADLIQFTGGADVTPAIYGEENTASGNSERRDFEEAGYFAIARRMGKPMAGICRGGQFLNVMCGGSMIQNVEGHTIHGTHLLEENSPRWDDTKGTMYRFGCQVTSTHHQMMVASDEGQVLAYASIRPNEDYDTEVVIYENEQCLCFQPHPEFDGYKECTDYYFELLNRCLGLRV